jgi:hypothetical protein
VLIALASEEVLAAFLINFRGLLVENNSARSPIQIKAGTEYKNAVNYDSLIKKLA